MINRFARNEFSKRVKLQAWGRSNGHCEDCGAKLFPGRFTYDHDLPDYLGGDNSLENCRVKCRACDTSKTAKDQSVIAKVRRQEEKHLGVQKPKGFGSRFKRKVDGTVVLRETGEPVR